MIAVSSRQIGHYAISGNISLFQIHQKIKKVVQRLQSANFETEPSVVKTMTVEYDFISKAMLDAICTKWMQCWTICIICCMQQVIVLTVNFILTIILHVHRR